MRKLLFGAAVAIVMSGYAQAADIGYGQPQYAPPPPPVAYRWMGPYVGGNVGYLWGDVDNSRAQPSGMANVSNPSRKVVNCIIGPHNRVISAICPNAV